MAETIRSFIVTHRHWTDYRRVVNHRTASGAKREAWRDLRDPCPDVRWTDLRVRVNGPAVTSPDFARVADRRGLPDARCGDRVRVGDAHGTIVGHNDSANFDVLFDDDAPCHAGQVLNVHPHYLTLGGKELGRG